MDVAALGLRVDGVENLDKATTSLNQFAAAESGASKAAGDLATGTKQAKPALDALSAASAKAAAEQAKLEAMAAKAGISVGQMKAALRGVPAQFTDIATSLQGGMNPLTVFLQQGGQLKDMFGGALPAARALGGYVASLANPFTIAAAAVGVLGFAYYQGSQEADNFRKALATTGNAAGLTVGQLQAMSQSMEETRGTVGAAAEALGVMVAAGVRADGELQKYTETALRWSKATGEGVEQVAERFVALQKDPLTAALKLNETTNFLTASVYDQIKALDEQGNTTDAARVAMDAYNSAMANSAQTIEQNLGSLERGWNAVAGAAKGAWDWMLNIGRQASLIDRLAQAQSELTKLETETVGLYERGTYKKRLADQRALVTALMDEVAAEEANAAGKKEAARQVAAKTAWDKVAAKSLSDEEKLTRDLEDARKKATAAGATEAELQKVLAKIQDDYDKKQKKPSGGTGGVSELASIQARVAATQQYIKALQEQGSEAKKATEGEQLAYKIQQEINSGRLTSSQLVQKQKELEAAKTLQAAEEQVRAEQKRIEMVEKAKKAELDRQNAIMEMEANLQAQRAKQSAELESYGMGDRAAAEMQARLSLQQEQLKAEADIRKQYGEELRKAETDSDRAQLEGMFTERLNLLHEYQAQELALHDQGVQAKRAKDEEWMLGFQKSLNDYVETSQNKYKLAQDFATKSLNGITDAFTNMVMTGKLDMKSLAQSIIADLVRIAVQAMITRAAMSIFSFFTGVPATPLASSGVSIGGVDAMNGYASGGYTGPGGKNEPAGIVHKGEVVFSQEDVARHGGVAAVEAIRKGSTASLERHMVGSAATTRSGGLTLNMPITISAQTNGGGVDSSKLEQAGAQITKLIRPAVQDEVAKMMRPGGLLWSAR